MNLRRSVCAFLIACQACFLGQSAWADTPPNSALAAWQRERDAIRADRTLLRYYTFDEPLAAKSPIASLVGTGPLTYQVSTPRGARPEAFQVVPGRWPGKRAVRLDQNVLSAPQFIVPGRGFSIAAWLRIDGIGTHRGNNGSTNGTLLSMGSGYWDGFRVTYQYPSRTLGFEIGRPKPSHSVSVRTGPVPDGVWHHLVATWDGEHMRLFVDGLAVACGEFDGVWTTPEQGQFRIGFAGSGVGSVRMDVAEVAIFSRALGADEVLCQASLAPRLSAALALSVRKASACLEAKDPAGAERELAEVLESDEAHGELAAALRLWQADCLLGQNRSPEAGRQLMAILSAGDVGPQLQATALVKLRGLVKDSPGNAIPAGAHERLLALSDLTADERWAVQLALGHRRFAARDFAGARAVYSKIADDAAAPPMLRGIVGLRIAQTYARQGDSAAAQAEYGRLAARADLPSHLRWEATQQIDQLRRVAKGLPARDPAASRVRLPKRPAPSVVLYVATNGADTNPGTADKPFASLERARDEIRRKKQAGQLGAGAEVRVRGGRYAIHNTFELTAVDSGTERAPIVYRAEAGQSPTISGGIRLNGFQPVRDPKVLARLPEASRGKVLEVDLRRAGIREFKPLILGGYASGHGFRTFPVMELYCNGAAMPLARWPNQGWAEVADIVVPDGHKIHHLTGSRTGRITYQGDRPRRWLAESDAFLHGYWFWAWADSYERIAAIDPEKREFTLAKPWHRYGYRKGQRYYAVNLLAELDSPGEWYLDRQSGRLYFFAPCDLEQAVVELSVFDQPMVRMEKVEHVALESLRWDLGAADAVMLRGCRDCLLAGCTIARFAGDGVLVDGGSRCGVLACNIASMGRGAISISGGDRKTLAPAGHFVENCLIHHLSRIHPTYTPGVRLIGVGSRIAHNLFHDIASSAINLGGNDHLVEFNEAYNVVMESDDQGGVDMFGNPTFRGNVYRYNFWHHVGDWQGTGPDLPGGRAGIRLDDAISGVLVYGNIFYRAATGTWPFGGLQIHGGKDNLVDNNLFVDCHVAISFSPWGEKRWREYTQTTLDARDIDRQLYLRRYPLLARLAEDHDANTIARNVVYRCEEFQRRDRGANVYYDNCLTADNPGCPAAHEGRFPFRPNPPVLDACGFAPIPAEEIGLYRDGYRPALPARESE
jgi:hypothetical protein